MSPTSPTVLCPVPSISTLSTTKECRLNISRWRSSSKSQSHGVFIVKPFKRRFRWLVKCPSADDLRRLYAMVKSAVDAVAVLTWKATVAMMRHQILTLSMDGRSEIVTVLEHHAPTYEIHHLIRLSPGLLPPRLAQERMHWQADVVYNEVEDRWVGVRRWRILSERTCLRCMCSHDKNMYGFS
ncbi:hypothetical protein PYCCODRAFT_99132 [Trametes coccinea BRFM310]|uniref:Uncharacterized protein n=1 Tax=Trametes coccinea (strain BRFM310) TaxID=1353009 RepID=A0A1Y2ITI6_TRAC3|nr:hypothetical protein PYCCODRAFT_99132 [Trametes coccinea BRFM310]